MEINVRFCGQVVRWKCSRCSLIAACQHFANKMLLNRKPCRGPLLAHLYMYYIIHICMNNSTRTQKCLIFKIYIIFQYVVTTCTFIVLWISRYFRRSMEIIFMIISEYLLLCRKIVIYNTNIRTYELYIVALWNLKYLEYEYYYYTRVGTWKLYIYVHAMAKQIHPMLKLFQFNIQMNCRIWIAFRTNLHAFDSAPAINKGNECIYKIIIDENVSFEN